MRVFIYKRLFILALVATSQFTFASHKMSCDDYEKTVTAKESWLSCNIDDPRYGYSKHVAIVDLYVGPEVEGKRQAIAWYGQSGLDPVLNALDSAPGPLDLEDAFVDENFVQLKFPSPVNDKSYAMISLKAQRDQNQSMLDNGAFVAGPGNLNVTVPTHHLFSKKIKWSRNSLRAGMSCTMISPAIFESHLSGDDIGCDYNSLSQIEARGCQRLRLWKSVHGTNPVNRMFFFQEANGNIKCEIRF